jgi:TPR repeat protein
MYNQGKGVPQDYKKAFQWYSKAAADLSKPLAQYNLGVLYYNGNGVPQDSKKAFELIAKAAGQGVVKAQLSLGKMYESGVGAPKEYETAYVWYSLAAVSSNKEALIARDALERIIPPKTMSEAEAEIAQKLKEIKQARFDADEAAIRSGPPGASGCDFPLHEGNDRRY